MAQGTSEKGRFEVDVVAGCFPLTVNITDLGTVSDNGAPILYNFNGNRNNPQSLFYSSQTDTTYNEPGTYLIVQLNGNVANPNDRFDFIEVRVFEDRAPFIGISTCSNNRALLIFDFDFDPFDFYEIDFGDGNTRQLSKTGSHIITHDYAQQDTYTITAQGQFNSGGNTACSRFSTEVITTITEIPTPVIDSLIVQDEDELILYYQQLNERLVYNLEIDFGNGFEFFETIEPQTNGRSFTIRDLTLNNFSEFYRFRIEATDFCESSSRYSDPISSIAFNHEAASFTNDIEVELSWATSTVDFNALDFYVGQSFERSFTNPTNTSGFTLTFENCTEFGELFMEHIFNGKLSRSIVLTPFEGQNLDLPPPPTPTGNINGAGITLNFDPPAFPVAEYIILRNDEQGTFQQLATTNTNTFQDNDVPSGVSQVCYAIRYIDQCGNTSEQSQQVCIAISGLLRVPGAFTPNGDGINDIFRVSDGIFQSFEMLIYNRWGTLVFHTTDASIGWGGTFDGQPAFMGTYTYKITFVNADDIPRVKSGTFILIR